MIEILLKDARTWLPDVVRAGEERERQLVELGFSVSGRRMAQRGDVEVGEPMWLGEDKVAIPVSWRAVEREALFPKVEADLEVAPLGAGVTQLSVSARYQPPLGTAGRILDRTLLHRVAEAVMRDFVNRIAAVLESGAGAGRTTQTPS